MSGHSKWSTIKRKKEIKDISKGKIFSRLAKGISVAVKTGGGADPESNYKLRVAIDAARQANMPKQNIDRAISKGSGAEGNLEEIVYEGFGPGGFGVLIEVATDNKNRTSQEIKNIFDKRGGSLSGPGSVSFNFQSKGLVRIKKKANTEEKLLALIDHGVEDWQEEDGVLEVYTDPHKLFDIKSSLQSLGLETDIIKTELVQRPLSFIKLDTPQAHQKALSLLDTLEEVDDVQRIFDNIDPRS